MFDLSKTKAAVIVASDSRSGGQRTDETGPRAKAALAQLGMDTDRVIIVPDDRDALARSLRTLAADPGIGLIVTAGGTGLSPRDNTPEATLDVIEKVVPGIPEMLRYESLRLTPKAALSRGVAGILNRTLIINLPGSPKAVSESIAFLAKILPHALETVLGLAVECQTNSR